MNSIPSGVCQNLATVAEAPTTAITSSSRPAAAMVSRKNGSESIRPDLGSTSSGS